MLNHLLFLSCKRKFDKLYVIFSSVLVIGSGYSSGYKGSGYSSDYKGSGFSSGYKVSGYSSDYKGSGYSSS